MNTEKTYIYILFLAVWMLSSCSSDPEIKESGESSEMSFSVSDATRADVSEISRFTVYGDVKQANDDNARLTTIFNRTEIFKSNDIWEYDETQYWIAGYEHSFVGIYPPSVVGNDRSPLYSGSRLSFNYSLPSDANNNVTDYNLIDDILAATHRRLYYKNDVVKPIIFRFGHMMSKINLSATFDDNALDDSVYLTFHELKMTGIKTKASFNITPDARLTAYQTDDMVAEITPLNQEGTLTVKFENAIKIPNNGERKTLFDDKSTILMIPQNFTQDSEAKIVLTYTVSNKPDILGYATIPLADFKWEMGKSYNYRFTIESRRIVIDECQIKQWESVDGGEISVD